MQISIVLPYPEAERLAMLWAGEEADIDFRRDPDRAARCTLAFAATELQHFLGRTLPAAGLRVGSSSAAGDVTVELRVDDPASKDDRFSLEPIPGGVRLTGRGRTGALYAAYELLRLQGWRWYAPGKLGEVAPAAREDLVLPLARVEAAPSMSFGRGFDFEGVSKESAELWLWMARNRLNLATHRPATGALGHKLGMSMKVGGHIFEEILSPNRYLPSGRTLWEEHQAWYGLPPDGIRRRDRALATQFCVAQPDLIDFLGAEVLRRIMGDWYQADRIDIWGFDTWGNTCACPECARLGNSSDQTLFFLSGLRRCLDCARATGRLDHEVRLVVCAYEGTATLSGPQRPIPANLVAAGDGVTYYPINRCYAHDIADSACAENARYHAALASWLTAPAALPITIGEYYNVSKFEDLPLLFTRRLRADLPAYHALGARGLTYMHVPLVNWGMRTLTQSLYAQLAWDTGTDVDAFLEGYFRDWYGPYAADLRTVYALLEEAWLPSADWRAWAARSVLSQLLRWDGARPTQPLPMDNHFRDPAGAIASGRQSAELMAKALASLAHVRAREREDSAAAGATPTPGAVNPAQQRQQETQAQIEMRLGEERRLLRYGLEVMGLMTECVAYHDALHRDDRPAAEVAWEAIETVADALDSFYIPIGFEQPGAGLVSRDALTRSQLRDLLRRCRQQRAASGPKQVSG
jgi:hypothetical protein